MSGIQEIILYISTTSQKSISAYQFARSKNLDITIIKLDSKEVRAKVSSGQIPVKHVPTLWIVYDDGNLKVFEGKDKTIAFLSDYFKYLSSGGSQENDDIEVVDQDDRHSPLQLKGTNQDDMYGQENGRLKFKPIATEPSRGVMDIEEERPSMRKSLKDDSKQKKIKKPKKKHREKPIEEEEPEFEIIQDDEEEYIEKAPRAHKSKKQSKKTMSDIMKKAQSMKDNFNEMTTYDEDE